MAGYSGDGGQATAAQIWPRELAIDKVGNIYMTQDGYIRKIDTAGIITTVAGNGTAGYSGDGGPATAAQIESTGIALDTAGNLYIVYSSRLRKVSSATGIITTIAGYGVIGFSGDGGPATLAQFNWPHGIVVDREGNIYIADTVNDRIRKVSTTGIVSTVAGSGYHGFSGDGGPATLAGLRTPGYITIAPNGDIYFSDGTNHRIRKITNGRLATPEIKRSIATLKVYPNPAINKIEIEVQSVVNEAVQITITDMTGKVVRAFASQMNSVYSISLEVPGIYLVGAQSSTGKLCEQVVVR